MNFVAAAAAAVADTDTSTLRRPPRRVYNATHPYLRVSEFARLGPHFVGYAQDREGLRLLHFRVPQREDPLYEALPRGAPWDSEGLLLYFRAPPRSRWDINSLLDQRVHLYSRLFHRKRWEWSLAPRQQAPPLDTVSHSSLQEGCDEYLAPVKFTEHLFSGQGTIGLVRVTVSSVSFKSEYDRLSAL